MATERKGLRATAGWTVSVLALLVATASPAEAEDVVRGTWNNGSSPLQVLLVGQGDGSYVGLSWRGADAYRLVLACREGDFVLSIARRGRVAGLLDRLEPGLADPEARRARALASYLPHSEVPLRRAGHRLSGGLLGAWAGEWELFLPAEVEDPVQPDAPRAVTVLITGFDRFPRPANHPAALNRPAGSAAPMNPSGWAVRHFDVERLPASLRERVDLRLHRLNDVPVVYVEGARIVTDAIERLRPDIVISFGVGAEGGADADVERVCENVMDDVREFGLADKGPFFLPEAWPPRQTDRSRWRDADRAWLFRFPDNAGVSYNGALIDDTPGAPATLESTLPVDRIVAKVKAAGLRAIDGGTGPGRYICNNVMYRVIQAQSARGRLGGFIHVNSVGTWSEARGERYLEVVACAIEESVLHFLEQAEAEGLPAPGLANLGDVGDVAEVAADAAATDERSNRRMGPRSRRR